MRAVKNFVNTTVLFFLGRALKATYRLDPDVKKELDCFGEKHKIMMSVANSGSQMSFWVENGKVLFSTGKAAKSESAKLSFEFKNTEAAFLVLTGQIGVDMAYCQHRMLVYGDIYAAMGVVRIMDRLENYLFPPFITNKILKRRPKKAVSSLRVYAGVLFGI